MWSLGAVTIAVLACFLSSATEKGRQLLWGKKCTPR